MQGFGELVFQTGLLVLTIIGAICEFYMGSKGINHINVCAENMVMNSRLFFSPHYCFFQICRFMEWMVWTIQAYLLLSWAILRE